MKALEILKEYRNIDYGCDMDNHTERCDEAIEELEEAMNLTRREWYQKGFNEAMKPKTCDGCKHKPNDGECYYEPCGTCARFFYDHYELKVTP